MSLREACVDITIPFILYTFLDSVSINTGWIQLQLGCLWNKELDALDVAFSTSHCFLVRMLHIGYCKKHNTAGSVAVWRMPRHITLMSTIWCVTVLAVRWGPWSTTLQLTPEIISLWNKKYVWLKLLYRNSSRPGNVNHSWQGLYGSCRTRSSGILIFGREEIVQVGLKRGNLVR